MEFNPSNHNQLKNALLEDYEKKGIAKSIHIVIQELGEDVSTRTGFLIKEYEDLLQKISMGRKFISFSKDELTMIHQVLNEVFYGINHISATQLTGINDDQQLIMLNQLQKEIANF